ncbi:MAG: hypothetical protein ACOCX0_03240, partial [Bacteroidota bacterium]
MKESDLTPHDKPLKSEGNDTPGLPHFSISQEEVQKILSETRERLKELGAINKTTAILKQEKPAPDMLKEIVRILPPAWQYPDDAVARIKYGKDSFTSSSRFRETQWYQKKSFETIDAKEGSIEVFYLNKHPNSDEGPFLIEERDLINNL